MALLRLALICAVLAVGLPACGDKLEPGDEESEWIKRTVPVRVLTASLYRGGTAVLYPDGRAYVGVNSIGGPTSWRGTWTEKEDVLTITLPRSQKQGYDWSAPEDLDPPDEVVLRKTGNGTWIESRSTLTPLIKVAMPWKLEAITRMPKAAIEKDYRFISEEEWDAKMGWGVVEDLPGPAKGEK